MATDDLDELFHEVKLAGAVLTILTLGALVVGSLVQASQASSSKSREVLA